MNTELKENREAQEVTTLLFVDDEPFVLDSLRRIFQDSAYKLRFAESASRALEVLAAEHVQLVVSDYRMPGMNGGEFLKLVSERWPDTVRLILSGYADVASVVAAINEGQIYKFVSKPWVNEELRTIVREGVERFWQQATLRELAEVAVAENNALIAPHMASLERLRQRHASLARVGDTQTVLEAAFELLPIAALVFCNNELISATRSASALIDSEATEIEALAAHPTVKLIIGHMKDSSMAGSIVIPFADSNIDVTFLQKEDDILGSLVVAVFS